MLLLLLHAQLVTVKTKRGSALNRKTYHVGETAVLYHVSASEGAPARESVPLIEKVLYGAEQEHPRDNGRGMGDGLRDIPSTYDLVNMTLKEAKSLTKVLREQSGTVPTEHTAEHGGHAVIVDLFSSAASADAAEALEKVR
jgi:hypothetical protein